MSHQRGLTPKRERDLHVALVERVISAGRESPSDLLHVLGADLIGAGGTCIRGQSSLLTLADGCWQGYYMPRKLRMEYEGAIYHVLNRGDRREPIFRGDADRNRFLETLGETCAKTEWQVHALCLMGNDWKRVGEEWAAIRRGWFFGADELKRELLAKASERVGAQHYGAERQESGEAKAERLVQEGLAKLGWQEADLVARRKGASGKVSIARRLRRETTMTLAWIARRLHMGAWTHVSNLLRAKPGRVKGED